MLEKLLLISWKVSKPVLLLVLLAGLISSCVSKKEIIYLQDIEGLTSASDSIYSRATIRPNDLLSISVTAFDMEAAAPFNLIMPATTIQEQANPLNRNTQGYLVNPDGTIEFPVIGNIKVGGLTRQQLIAKLKQEISIYLINPIVNVNILNYKVTVLGEVARPGTYSTPDERITLLEAIGMAGDLTIYGKRDNILVLREIDGMKTYKKIDITQSDFLQSPFYYLQQNDVVYVQPNKAQIGGAAYNRNTSVYISIASVVISLIVLIAR